MARLFISYASPDNKFAVQLAGHLQQLGHTVWFDQWEIGVGDWIPSKIATGMDQAEYLVVVLSKHTAKSMWVDIEVQIKYWEEATSGRSTILPIVIDDCAIPVLLRPKRVADFRSGYEVGLAQVALTLGRYQVARPDLVGKIDECPVVATSPLFLDSVQAYTDTAMLHIPKFTEVNIELSLPYVGKIAGVWKPAEEEQKAAWELYVELVTRVSIAGLPADQGLLRESLTSLHTIFTLTRDILRRYGPSIARPTNGSDVSFGSLGVPILNYVLRPVLATWHPLLLDYEHKRLSDVSPYQHEQQWERGEEFRTVLHDTQTILIEYSKLLAQVAQVPSLVTATKV